MVVAGERLHELEMLDERVVLAGNRTRDHRGIGRGFFVVELVALAARATLDALKAPHEVEVPIAAAELAIGHDLQARSFLLGDEVANGRIFNSLELGCVNDARIEIGACLFQHVRTKKTADDIAAKRRVGFGIHSHI